ncbi:MAG TPA: NF038129 family PEP-CTERM protein [Opitutaceae bacterium]|nr:NF038129 family PEP-CTERM protein [Opitutaceae bacterium]
MNMHLPPSLTRLVLVSALLCAPALRAGIFDFHIDFDTGALTSAPNAPFYLDFQLNEGSGSLPNSVTLSHFVFDGGSPLGSPMPWSDGTGDLSSAVSLSDSPSSPFNEFSQGFTPGTTGIHFDVAISQNSPGAIPDEFAAAILDSEPGYPQIATNAPDGVSLVTLDIAAANALADVQTYGSTSPAGVTATAIIPEPSDAVALFGGAAALLAGFCRFRRRTA